MPHFLGSTSKRLLKGMKTFQILSILLACFTAVAELNHRSHVGPVFHRDTEVNEAHSVAEVSSEKKKITVARRHKPEMKSSKTEPSFSISASGDFIYYHRSSQY